MEWFKDHKYNNNLVRVQFESRKAIYTSLQIVLGANKSKLPKGNRKDSGKENCFRTHFILSSAKEIQEERNVRASGRLQVSQLSSKTFKICRLHSVLKFRFFLIQNLLIMWQSINGLIDQRTPKGLEVFC